MHIRNIFRTPPDFQQLGELYPDLQQHLIQVRRDYHTINFKDPAALSVLTCALASHYFDITLDLPTDRLIPTLPLRMNYLLWIQDLLAYQEQDEEVFGIDIGTGASAVYALLGQRNFGWKFLGTETEAKCHEAATSNVLINSVQSKVTVKLVDSGSKKLIGNLGTEQYTFCMCNPPFFEDTENMTGLARSANRAEPKSVCTATPVEVITEGGEEQFVGDIVRESLELGDRVFWYTSMLGRKTSLEHVLGLLAECGVSRVAVTEFKQGNTTRWGIAWSHSPSIPPLLFPSPRKPTTTYTFTTTLPSIVETLKYKLTQLHVQSKTYGKLCADASWHAGEDAPLRAGEDAPLRAGEDAPWCAWITASCNTWAHSRRKRRKESTDQEAKRTCLDENNKRTSQESVNRIPENCSISYHVTRKNVENVAEPSEQSESNKTSEQSKICLFHALMSVHKNEDKKDKKLTVEFTWIFGSDKDALNQMCCYLSRAVKEAERHCTEKT